MKLVLTTAAAQEPVSLTELKEVIRAESTDFADHLDQYQSIAPGSQSIAASYSLKGSGVSVLAKRALVRLNAGDCSAGTATVKIQEAIANSDASYSDWTGGAFTAVNSANDNAIQEIEYTGTKQYIRAVATVATGACSFSVTVECQAATHPEDNLLTNLIIAAREYAEDYTGRAFITQSWTGYMDCFPISGEYFKLAKPPVQSITSIKYRDSDWAEAADWTTWASTNYVLDIYTYIPRIYLASSASWPSYTEYPVNSVEVVMVCGYGDDRADVPEQIRRAILRYAATMYEHREDFTEGHIVQAMPVPFTVDRMLEPYRVEPR